MSDRTILVSRALPAAGLLLALMVPFYLSGFWLLLGVMVMAAAIGAIGLNHTAFRQLKNVDTGLTSVLDFSVTGRQPSRQTYVTKVDSSVPGGLTLQGAATESRTAEGYTSAG